VRDEGGAGELVEAIALEAGRRLARCQPVVFVDEGVVAKLVFRDPRIGACCKLESKWSGG
jgi:hypothetical protein